jgi:hypothetical protein
MKKIIDFNLQKKILKKSIKLDNYVWKSGLLDFCLLFAFLILFLLASFSVQYFTVSFEVLEQDYASLLLDDSLSDEFKIEIGQDFLNNLKVLINIVIISFASLILLMYIFETLIKQIQYKILFKKSKIILQEKYFKRVLLAFRNTLPLFFGFWLIIFLLIILFSFRWFVLIIALLLSLVYAFAMPLLRLATLKNNDFKKSWKLFFKYIKKIPIINIIPKFLILIWLISFGLLSWLTLISPNFLSIVFSIIQLILLILTFVFVRRAIYNSTLIVDGLKEKNHPNKKLKK